MKIVHPSNSHSCRKTQRTRFFAYIKSFAVVTTVTTVLTNMVTETTKSITLRSERLTVGTSSLINCFLSVFITSPHFYCPFSYHPPPVRLGDVSNHAIEITDFVTMFAPKANDHILVANNTSNVTKLGLNRNREISALWQ